MSEEFGIVSAFLQQRNWGGEGTLNLGLHKFAFSTMAVSLPRYLFLTWLLISCSLTYPLQSQ